VSACTVPRPAHLEGLERYEPGLPIEEVQRELGLSRVVKLASNENPLGPSPRAMEALRGLLPELNRYPDGPATRLREAIAARHGLSPDQVAIGNGSTDLIDLLARAFLGREDNAVISEAAFARFQQVVRARNGQARLVPMRDHTHDLGALRQALDGASRLLFVANPNNPTGTWNPRAEIEALIESLPGQVVLALDEAYFEYAEHPDFPDGVDYVRRGDPVVVLRTFSKVYGLAGLRVGYAIAPPEIIDAIDTVREPFNTNAAGQVAALAALADTDHVARSVALVRVEKPRLSEALAGRGLRVLPSLGNFLCVEMGRPGAEVFRALLRRGVIVRPLGPYRLDRWLRVSVGTAEENTIFLAALDAVLAEVPPQP
jgi:histidinol-phosphate aminotransferase